MRIDSSGNVGIGTSSPITSSPVGTLDAAGVLVSRGVLTLHQTSCGVLQHNSANNETVIRSYGSSAGTGILAFNTGGGGGSSDTERMRIDSSGHVVIQDDAVYTTNAPTYRGSLILAGASGTGSFGGIEFHTNAGGGAGYGTKIAASDAFQTFAYRNNSASWTESMRITNAGNILVGNSYDAFNARANIYASGSGTSTITLNLWNGGGSGCIYERYVNSGGAAIGSITQNGASAVSFNTTSDARLKDVTGSARGLEVINELNPVSYNWKADGQADEGLIAQEVMDIVPNAVSGSEEDYYQMDYSKLVVHLVAGMKEQQAQIEALQSEINLLKGE